LDILQKSGLKVMFNGDWTEQSPLEKQNGLSFWRFIRTRFQSNSYLVIEREYATLALAKKSDKNQQF
jgi:iron complex transport system substrate-binding protein